MSRVNIYFILIIGLIVLVLLGLYFGISGEIRSRSLEQELQDLKRSLEESKPSNLPTGTDLPTSEFPNLVISDFSLFNPIVGTINKVDQVNNILHIYPDPLAYEDLYFKKIVEVLIPQNIKITMAIEIIENFQSEKELLDYKTKYGDPYDGVSTKGVDLNIPTPPSPFIEEPFSLGELRAGQIVAVFPRKELKPGTLRFEAYRLMIYSDDFR